MLQVVGSNPSSNGPSSDMGPWHRPTSPYITAGLSVDMIKLLFQHDALTNLSTAGDLVIEGLLPLHVAVEDTCLHKYLEDNLLPSEEHPNHPTKEDANFVYKIIYLLCLPEMVCLIFLATDIIMFESSCHICQTTSTTVLDY